MIATHNIPDDPHLPFLAVALDPVRMQREFQQHFLCATLPLGDFFIEACGIEQARYKPQRNCLILYQLLVLERASGARHDVRLCARMFPPGTSLSRFERARAGRLIEPAIGPALVHIPALDMIVWTFPNERKLDGLAALTSAATVAELVDNLWGSDVDIARLHHEILHYVPEHACSVRVEITLQHRATDSRFPWPLIGKTYYNDQGAETFRVMQELQASLACDRGELLIPMPVAYQPHAKILWQETLPGQTLMEADGRADSKAHLFALAGHAVGALHRTPVSGVMEVRVDDILSRLAEVSATLCQARPAIRAKLAQVINRLGDRVVAVSDYARATLHGDLHMKNIFVMGERVALIDLDNIAIGPPLHDIGSFVASLLYRDQLAGNAAAMTNPSVAAFLAAYRASVPWHFAPAQLHWYTAAALINERAFRCLSRLKEGRLELLDQLVELADRISDNSWEMLHHAA